VIARGDVFSPDALVAAPFAAVMGRPLLLTPQCAAPPSVARYLDDLDVTTLNVTGGPDAVCDAVLPRYL
jgi:hypothetical protein